MIEQFFQIGENWIDKEEYLFQLIDAIVFLCFMVCVLYLFVFAVYSKRKSTYKYPTTMKKYRFAALFPAYGEDEVIIDSVKSFLQQDYPRELYDIIVIANQMRQETLDRLKSLSVKIIKMENPQSTKIEALKAAIRYIEEGKTKYDNVIILDADNIVKNNYIEKINDAIQQLPPKCKHVFFLAKIEGLPYKDIAALLDISVKTINNHIAFALEEIAKKLNIHFRK